MKMIMINLLSTFKHPSLSGMAPTLALGLGLSLGWPALVNAEEIYYWVDANGVHHFSESPPPKASAEVRTLQVNGSQPASYDPTEDRYNIAAQEVAMQELRDKLEESRKNQPQDQAPSSASTVVYYPQPDVGNAILYPPGYHARPPHWSPWPKPPHHPSPPDGKPDKPGNLPDDESPASLTFRPLRPRP